LNLKEIRLRNNLKQEDVAKQIGKTIYTYGSYERNTREPDIETLCKLSKILNASVDEILGLETKNQQHNISNVVINEDEQELLNCFSLLPALEQGKVLGYAKSRLEEIQRKQELAEKTFSYKQGGVS